MLFFIAGALMGFGIGIVFGDEGVSMAFDPSQFRDLVAWALNQERRAQGLPFGFSSDAAIELLLGTCAVESAFGTYLKQIRGPAFGVFQMEPPTFYWLAEKFGFHDRSHFELEWNLRLAILAARYRYWAVPEPLPPADDLDALAAYWKQHYNTPAGAGRPEDFIRKYRKYVKGE
jgi:hypothetical protein